LQRRPLSTVSPGYPTSHGLGVTLPWTLGVIFRRLANMDAIESLVDFGPYAAFQEFIKNHPEIRSTLQTGYYLGDYLSVGILFSIAAYLFLWQGRRRSAQVTAISLAIAFGLLFGVRILVPRRRPDDAENWLGPGNMVGSYPSAGVFLFMLAMIFLGFAT